jgi:hypothetical protein
MRRSSAEHRAVEKRVGMASAFAELGESERYFRKEKNMEGGKMDLYDHVSKSLSRVSPSFLPIKP